MGDHVTDSVLLLPQPLRTLAKSLMLDLGIEVHRYRSGTLGVDPFRDMRRLAVAPRPIIFDVGANTGQYTLRFHRCFKDAQIHAFEPSRAFTELSQKTRRIKNVHLNHFGLGAHDRRTATFNEHESTEMSSFLTLGRDAWGNTQSVRQVQLRTLDSYCAEVGVEEIEILKCDTQGYDLEVLKGASEILGAGRVQMIYTEITLARLYEGLPSMEEIFQFLAGYNFRLVALYNPAYRNDRLGWMDGLFAKSR